MMNKLNSLRRNKGGFTLVELIVVLVILAILAALLIPALTGYIDEAKEKQIVAETRMCVMAVQTLYGEAYGVGEEFKYDGDETTGTPNLDAVEDLAEVEEDTIKSWTIDEKTHKVTRLVYFDGSVYGIYNGSSYEVSKTDPNATQNP